MAQRIVVVGGGAAGMGAAGAARGADPSADVRVYTEFEDVGYSPCGIPYVHGKEIPDFERLFLATREAYAGQGIDIHYETRVTGFSAEHKTVSVHGEGEIGYDRLIVATGFNYASPGVPGADLDGLYYVKNIRRAIEWDKVLDGVRAAVGVAAAANRGARVLEPEKIPPRKHAAEHYSDAKFPPHSDPRHDGGHHADHRHEAADAIHGAGVELLRGGIGWS